MTSRLSLLMLFTIYGNLFAQDSTVPTYYETDRPLSEKLSEMVKELGLDKDFNPIGRTMWESLTTGRLNI